MRGRWPEGRAWPRPAPRAGSTTRGIYDEGDLRRAGSTTRGIFDERDLRWLAPLLWYFVGPSRSLRRVRYMSHVVPGGILGLTHCPPFI